MTAHDTTALPPARAALEETLDQLEAAVDAHLAADNPDPILDALGQHLYCHADARNVRVTGRAHPLEDVPDRLRAVLADTVHVDLEVGDLHFAVSGRWTDIVDLADRNARSAADAHGRA